MKLVEKKCPNCGAGLSFNSSDKEVTCKYCNVSFEVEREASDYGINIDTEKLSKVANDLLDSSNFILHEKTVKKIGSVFFIIWAFAFIFIFAIFIIMAVNIIPRVIG